MEELQQVVRGGDQPPVRPGGRPAAALKAIEAAALRVAEDGLDHRPALSMGRTASGAADVAGRVAARRRRVLGLDGQEELLYLSLGCVTAGVGYGMKLIGDCSPGSSRSSARQAAAQGTRRSQTTKAARTNAPMLPRTIA
jgi:hypothetical protein